MVASKETLEVRIGSRWLLYIGVIAIVVGAAYFIKLAFDNEWIAPAMRVGIGALLGLAFAYAGTRFVRAGYSLYGQMISGGGIAMLYVSTYAAFNFYHLIAQPVAFALMCGVSAFGAGLADRQRSQGLALMAVGGGFATPFLLPGDSHAQVALFTYDAIVAAGTMYLAGRREWPFLNLLSYMGVVFTFLAWALPFYKPSMYLSTEIFLTVFCAMFLYVLHATRKSTSETAGAVRAVLWSAPVAYYVASLVVLAQHSTALLVYLLVLSATGVGVSHQRRSSLLRFMFWLTAVVPLGGWISQHAGRSWLFAGLISVAGIYVLNVAAQFSALSNDGDGWTNSDILLLHGNALFTAFAAYLLVDAVRSDLTAPVIAGLAVWQGVLSAVLARIDRRVAIHSGALAFTFLAAATGLQFHGAALTAAWAAEGCAVIWLGLREQRGWLRLVGAAGFLVAIARLGVLLTDPPLAGQPLLLNERTACGVFIIALTYCIAWMHHRLQVQRTDTSGAGVQPCDPPAVAIALVTAKLLILAVACAEIAAYWTIHPAASFMKMAQYITAFTLVGAGIIWMALARREEAVRLVGGLVFGEAALLLLALHFEVAPEGYHTVFNARIAVSLIVIAMLYALAPLHRRLGAHVKLLEAQIGGFYIAANLLSLSMLTSEINAYWPLGSTSESATMAAQAMHAISWTGIGAALVWLGVVRREIWTRFIGWGVLTIAALMVLDLDSNSVFSGYVVVANPRFAATAILVAALYWLAWLARQDSSSGASAARAALVLAANGFTLLFLTGETSAFWHLRDASHAASRDSQLARGAMQSVMWATYAAGAIVVGIRRRYPPVRYFAIVIFALTIGKVFFVDMAELERVYRVVSVIGLGVMLLATSYMYERFRHRLA